MDLKGDASVIEIVREVGMINLEKHDHCIKPHIKVCVPS